MGEQCLRHKSGDDQVGRGNGEVQHHLRQSHRRTQLGVVAGNTLEKRVRHDDSKFSVQPRAGCSIGLDDARSIYRLSCDDYTTNLDKSQCLRNAPQVATIEP